MRFQIEAEPLGPLRILRELPDASLAVLEGLNGIGKTLSVRLLEVCTGTLPYPKDSPAWRSMCSGLGSVVVTASGLRDDTTIRWEADTRSWATREAEHPTFSSITIDGRPASLDEVRRHLVVYRIAGDEGIVDTFAHQPETAAEVVQRWARAHTAEAGSPLAALESAAGNALDALGSWTATRLEEVVRAAAEADSARDATAAATKLALERRERLRALLHARTAFEDMRTALPEMLQRSADIDLEIVAVTQHREEIQQRLMELAARVGGSQSVIAELRNARRTLERNQLRLAEQLGIAATLAAQVEVEPEPAAVAVVQASLESELGELEAERRALDQAPAMRHLLDDVTDEFASAAERGLGDQIALDDPETDVQMTVAQAHAGMATRRAFLEGQPPPPEAKRVADAIAERQRRLSGVTRLSSVLAEAARRQRLVGENQERLDRALRQRNPEAASQLQELEASRRTDDARLLSLATERASLRQRLSGLGTDSNLDAVDARIRSEADELGIALGDLDDAIAEADRAASEAEDASAEAAGQRATAHRELARATADIRRALASLAADKELMWVRAVLNSTLLPDPTASSIAQVRALEIVRDRVAHIAERLGSFRVQVAAVGTALAEVARHLRGHEPEAITYVSELQAWYGYHFSEWFNTPGVRTELLPAATGPISVDLASRTVNWTDSAGSWARPLEAFSSGEQAFAYTRARLAVLDEQELRPSNRLIVLDEFGAFLAHDRWGALLAYIKDRRTSHPEDQVLVILPLNRDYAEMAATSIGAEQSRLRALARDLADHDYAVQVLAT